MLSLPEGGNLVLSWHGVRDHLARRRERCTGVGQRGHEPANEAASSMIPFRQVLFVIGLGLFWGVSPAANKALGEAGIPVTHILVAAGLGVGVGLLAMQLAMGGRPLINRQTIVYGLVCGILMNIPWAFSLTVVRHVAVTDWAVITSTSPFFTYALALVVGRDRVSGWRLAALLVGFLSSVVLILTRPGALAGELSPWLLVALLGPFQFAFYNVYTGAAWPKGMDPLTAGIVESFAAGLTAVPFMLWLDPPQLTNIFAPESGTATLLFVMIILMWVLERVCYFNMVQHWGPVTTVQAVYVSTPAGVLFGLLLYKEAADAWLFGSLFLLMLALWLNNRAIADRPRPTPG